MRNLLIAVVLIMVLGAAASAQRTPAVEVFGGYTRLTEASFSQLNHGLNGWDTDVAYNVNDEIGLVVDVSRHSQSQTINFSGIPEQPLPPPLKFDIAWLNVTAGPRFSVRTDRYTLFGHTLLGYTRFSTEVSGLDVSASSDSSSGFASVLGGGLDINLNSFLAVRPGKVEYLYTHFGGSGHGNFRYSGGIVFRFGSR